MTARNRTTRKAAKPRVGKYIAIVALMLVVAGIAASVSATYSLAMSWLKDLPDYSDSDAYLLAEPTQVLDADGNVIAQFYMENRTPITKEQCSQYVLWATVDTEDERFYEHNGVDIKGILRAVVAQLSGGSEGASTSPSSLCATRCSPTSSSNRRCRARYAKPTSPRSSSRCIPKTTSS